MLAPRTGLPASPRRLPPDGRPGWTWTRLLYAFLRLSALSISSAIATASRDNATASSNRPFYQANPQTAVVGAYIRAVAASGTARSMARSATEWDSSIRDMTSKVQACSERICDSSNEGSPEGSELFRLLQERRVTPSSRRSKRSGPTGHGPWPCASDRPARRWPRSTVGRAPWPVARSRRKGGVGGLLQQRGRQSTLTTDEAVSFPSRSQARSARVRLSCASAKANISASAVAAAAQAGSASIHTPASTSGWLAHLAPTRLLGDQFRIGGESGGHAMVEPGTFARQDIERYTASLTRSWWNRYPCGRRRRPEGGWLLASAMARSRTCVAPVGHVGEEACPIPRTDDGCRIKHAPARLCQAPTLATTTSAGSRGRHRPLQ